MRHLSGHRVGMPVLFLAAAMAAPVSGQGTEAPELLRGAFRASSTGLTSGSGKGIYREYQAAGEDEWTLRADADISTYFSGDKYHVDLKYHPEFRGHSCRRITYDGRAVRTAVWNGSRRQMGCGTSGPYKRTSSTAMRTSDFVE